MGSHFSLYLRTKIGELLADCRTINFDKNVWCCRICGSESGVRHKKGCPITSLRKAYEILIDAK